MVNNPLTGGDGGPATATNAVEVMVVRNGVARPTTGGGAVEMTGVRDGVPRLRRKQTASSLCRADPEEWGAVKAALAALELDALIRNATELKETHEKMKAAEGSGAATRGALGRAQAQFTDFAGDLHLGVETAKEHAASASMTLSHSIAKEERLLKYGRLWDSLLEILNEAGDVAFLCVTLWSAAGGGDLFWASLAAIAVSVFVRVYNGWSVRQRVDWEDGTKRLRYCYGVAASLVEPLHGGRWIKKGFKDKDKGGWNRETHQQTQDRDKHAVRAENDLLTATAERNNGVALVLAEDVPELAIEIIYLIRTGASADALFYMTAIGTFLHMVRQLAEAWALHREMPGLRLTAECRDKVFEPGAADADVVAFAERGGLEVRRVNLSRNKNITDEAVRAIADNCPHLTTINLGGCENITAEAVQAFTKKLPKCLVRH